MYGSVQFFAFKVTAVICGEHVSGVFWRFVSNAIPRQPYILSFIKNKQ